jgi:hypothetical protein
MNSIIIDLARSMESLSDLVIASDSLMAVGIVVERLDTIIVIVPPAMKAVKILMDLYECS